MLRAENDTLIGMHHSFRYEKNSGICYERTYVHRENFALSTNTECTKKKLELPYFIFT